MNDLLITATQKLIDLRNNSEWRNELPQRCPPILWFGDAISQKPRVVTVGANPSRQEYLAESSKKALARQDEKHQSLYLEVPNNRFYILPPTAELADILSNTQIQEDILLGYNRYFYHNPYRWFGKNKPMSYNVEGFLHGIDATYFSGYTYQAVHVDLFPFATIQDFNRIYTLANRDLFYTGWAKKFLNELLDILHPEIILVFGRANVDHYTNYISSALEKASWKPHHRASYRIGQDRVRGVRVIGLSTNLGNPKGFTAQELYEFGKAIKSEI